MPRKTWIIAFAIIVLGGFLFFWLYRSQMFSKEALYFELQGPQTATLGEEVTYVVKYKNQGRFTLEDPLLVFQFPDRVLTEDGKTRITKTLDDLYPGAEQYLTFKARLIGKENDLLSAHASLSYTPKNLSARYESSTDFATRISEVPITLTLDLPTKMDQNSQVTYDINYLSSVDYPLKNMSIRIDKVTGFTVKSSTPKSLDGAEWKLGTLEKGKGGRISITGNFGGAPEGQLEFSAHLGMWFGGTFVVLKDAKGDVEVAKPIPKISLSQSAQAVAVDGMAAHLVTWQVKSDLGTAKNVKVKAILPAGSSLNDYIVPEEAAARFTFDVASRQLVWIAGDLPSGEQATVSFQIIPGSSIPGMNLLGTAAASGEDATTGQTLSATASALVIP